MGVTRKEEEIWACLSFRRFEEASAAKCMQVQVTLAL